MHGIVYNERRDELVVPVALAGAILTFRGDVNGSEAPIRIIQGPKTRIVRPDTLYVDELIGPDTVNTMPPQTLAAFNDHGTVETRIERDLDCAEFLFRRLPELGVPIASLIDQLEPEGVAAFVKSYDSLLETLESRRTQLAAP